MSINVFAYPPIIQGRSNIISDTLIRDTSSYSHTVNADGWYESMSMSFSVKSHDMSDWVSNGIGRHIETRNVAGDVIWEGFVNQLDIKIGGVSFTIGPLTDISNRVYVTYTGTKWVPWGISFGGEQKVTTAANDTDSQSLYGILVEYYSGGTGSETEMNTLRDVVLGARANAINTDIQIDFSQGDFPVMSLQCLGYNAYLGKYTHSNSTIAEQNASVKITEVLDADPNSSTFISDDRDSITTNTLKVNEEVQDNQKADAIIKSVVALGDSSDNRYIFGVANDRIPYYRSVSEDLEYIYYARKGIGHAVDANSGARIRPWDMKPDKWLYISDVAASLQIPHGIAELEANPMAVYIQSVTYTMPDQVTITSGPTSRFSQKLARLGAALA